MLFGRTLRRTVSKASACTASVDCTTATFETGCYFLRGCIQALTCGFGEYIVGERLFRIDVWEDGV